MRRNVSGDDLHSKSISAGGLQQAEAAHIILLGTSYEEDVVPVILELKEYEAELVVDALMEGRIKLMKDWGDRYRSEDRSPFEGDLDAIDDDIVTVASVRERLKEGIMIEQFRITKAREAIKDDALVAAAQKHIAENARDQERLKVTSFTTLPEGFDISDEVDTWPYAESDPEETPSHVSFIKVDDKGTTVKVIDGRWIGPNTAKALGALVFRNFDGVSDKELNEAKEYIRTRPDMRDKLKANIDALFAAYLSRPDPGVA